MMRHMDARDWDRRWQQRSSEQRRAPSPVVAGVLESVPAGRALDLGCGPGRNAVWLAEQGWRVTAVDFSAEALRQAQGRAHAQGVEIEWVHADVTAYVPPAAGFDLVLVAYVHIPADERRRLVEHACSAVSPGGMLLLVGHDRENLGTGAPGPSSAAVLYSHEDVVADLVEGLTVERADQIRRPVVLEDGSEVEAVDALVVARR